jgi:hypothetical protein
LKFKLRKKLMPTHRWLLLACLLTAVAAFAARPARAQGTQITVSSAVYTNNTGIAVKAGQQIKIAATGTANLADDNGPYITDPNGTIVTAPPDGSGAFNFFENNASPEGEPPVAGEQKSIVSGGQLNGQPFGAIVAAILPNGGGDLTAFTLIGSDGTYKAPVDGVLCLSVNDINNTDDNQGSYVATVSTLTASIAAVEFTQAIQQYQTLADLKTYLAANGEPPVPLVNGKSTALRIYFNEVKDVTDVVVTVSGEAVGSQTVSLQPDCDPSLQRANYLGCQSVDFFFIPAEDTASFTITVTDTAGTQLDQQAFTLKTRTTKNLSIKTVTGCGDNPTFANGERCIYPGNIAGLETLLEAVVPVEDVNTDDSLKTVRATLAALTTSDFEDFTEALAKNANALYTTDDQIADFGKNSYTDYFTFFFAVYGAASGVAAGIPSHAAEASLAISTSPGDLQFAQSTVAHEAGHTLGLKHTNNSNPSTTSDPGCTGFAADETTYWPFADNFIQSSPGVYEYGYNTDTRTVVPSNVQPPKNTFELMGYCGPQWISPLSYTRLIQSLGGGPRPPPSVPASPSDFVSRNKNESQTAPALRPQPQPNVAPIPLTGPFWQIAGSIDPTNGVTFNPVFTQTRDGSSDPGAGTYSIEVLGSTSQVLYTRFFTPETAIIDNYTDTTSESMPYFSEWIPVTAGAASIAVIDSNSNTVGSLPITGPAPGARVRPAGAVGGSGAPVVTITSPAAGFVGSGVQTISWTAQETGVTNFTSRVLFSPDGGTTWYEQGDTATTSDTIDFGQMPGSANALIQVLVSDGINTGSATSASFAIPKHVPSMVAITNPPDGYAQPAADPVTLRGSAFDPDDRFLHGAALSWSSDIQGSLGTGSPLFVNLNPGTHNITLTATDSDGNSISTSISVVIGGGRPTVSLTTGSLSANCSSVTINAAVGAQGAPLSLVQYSVDGGVTYTTLALNQLPFTFTVPGSGIVNVVARAYDTSNQSAAQSAEIPIPAACTAGVPAVLGGANQAQVVGGVFGTPLAVVIKDAGGNPVPGVTVNFSAPSSGASAVLSAPSAVTNPNGVASVTATANGTSGTYVITASVVGFSTVAQFTLTNTDFTIAVDNALPTVRNGSTVEETVTITSLSGFNSTVTFGCTSLVDGVTCKFANPTATPVNGTATDGLTIIVAKNVKDQPSASLGTVLGGGAFFALCLAGAGGRRRQRIFRFVVLIGVVCILCGLSACNHFTPFDATINVTATSGGVTHSTAIQLFIK